MKEMRTSVLDYLDTIIKWRKIIIRNVIIITIAVLLITFLLPNQYTATATILPPSLGEDATLGIIAGGVSTNLARLSSFGGMLPGLATPSDLYAAILRSGNIKSKVVDRFNLKKEFKTKTYYDTYKILDEITKIKVSPEGIISVSVTYRNKSLAADIANSYIEELDRFNKETAMTTGKKYRMFVEQRLKETQDSLKVAEEALRKFQEQHRTVVLDIEIENAIATIAKLKSEIILREVQKGAVASFGGFNNPYVANIDQELREFKKQLARIEFGSPETTSKEFGAGFSVPFARLPELSLEYVRLRRDVKIQEAVFELLTQQYEQAKIMESKDTPTIQFIDKASPPERKSFPKRSIILFLSIIVTFIGNVLGIYIIKFVDAEKKAEGNSVQKLLAMWQTLKGDFAKILHKVKK